MNSLPIILAIALGLAMDAFAVAICIGTSLGKITIRHMFRLSFHFGLFQFLMPIIGWYAGKTMSGFLSTIDHWIAFILLVWVGSKMIYECLKDEEEDNFVDPTTGLKLVMLSIATSIDALAVGLSIGMLKVDILFPSIIIGLVAAAMTLMGMIFGSRLGIKFGKRMEIAGGIILIGIGVKILADHTLFS